MGKMKTIHNMFEFGLSNDRVAWYLLLNTKVSNWEQAKQVAQELRNEYDNKENEDNEKENDETAN